jgi:hypothetical protein
MLLLITGCKQRVECGETLKKATGHAVEVCETLRKAIAIVARREYIAIVVDQGLTEADPDAWETVLRAGGMALPIYVNIAISGRDRLVREVQTALRNQEQSRMLAMKAAESTLRAELREAVTAIVLASDLALHTDGLSTAAEQNLRTVYGTAQQLRSRFERLQ